MNKQAATIDRARVVDAPRWDASHPTPGSPLPGEPGGGQSAPGAVVGAFTGQFALAGKNYTVSGTVDDGGITPPPPPPPPALASFTGPATAKPGQAIGLEVTLSAPAPAGGAAVQVIGYASASGSYSVDPGKMSRAFTVTIGVGETNRTVILTATYGGKALNYTFSVQADTPVPAGVINVREKGAKGDGGTDDRAAIQKVVDGAPAGATIYFPTGRYFISDVILFTKGNVRLLGDGSGSVIDNRGKKAFSFGMRSGEPALPGYAVEKLKFTGLPGLYMKTGNSDPSLMFVAAKDALVKDCEFVGSGEPILCLGTTFGTKIQNCRATGWGEVGIFCNGGEQITGANLWVQDDPDLYGERSSHGLYIHSGVSDLLIDGMTIENARKFTCQLYGESEGTSIQNVVIRNCTFRNGQEGLTAQQGGQGKARCKKILIENCLFEGVYRYPAMWLKHGTDITIRNCTFKGAKHTAIALGRFNGWDSPDWATLENLLIENCTIDSCNSSLYIENVASRGKFINCVIKGLKITNSPQPVRNGDTTGVVIQP